MLAATVRLNLQRASNYVLGVVLCSVALFFGGVSTKVASPGLRVVTAVDRLRGLPRHAGLAGVVPGEPGRLASAPDLEAVLPGGLCGHVRQGDRPRGLGDRDPSEQLEADRGEHAQDEHAERLAKRRRRSPPDHQQVRRRGRRPG